MKVEVAVLSSPSLRVPTSLGLWFVFLPLTFFFTTIYCRLAVVNGCVIIMLSIGNTQISMLLLCLLYLFVELMITMNESNFG